MDTSLLAILEYNKSTGILILKKDKITGTDKENNIINAEFAQYNENTKILIRYFNQNYYF